MAKYWETKTNGVDVVDASLFNNVFSLIETDLDATKAQVQSNKNDITSAKNSLSKKLSISDFITYKAETSSTLNEKLNTIDFEKFKNEDFVELEEKVNGFSVPENLCLWGGCVSSADELPKNPTSGMVCIAKTDFAFNAYKFTGAVNELFECWEENGEIWIVRALFSVPNDCIIITDFGFGDERLTGVCNSSGKLAGMVHVEHPNGYPYHFTPDELGVSDITDTVTVYVPIPDGEEFSGVDVVHEGTALIYDGERWRGLTSTSESGNIESALNSIVAIQNILMGGVSV